MTHGSYKMFLVWPRRPGPSLSSVPLSRTISSSPGQKGVPTQWGAYLDGQGPPYPSPPAFQSDLVYDELGQSFW